MGVVSGKSMVLGEEAVRNTSVYRILARRLFYNLTLTRCYIIGYRIVWTGTKTKR